MSYAGPSNNGVQFIQGSLGGPVTPTRGLIYITGTNITVVGDPVTNTIILTAVPVSGGLTWNSIVANQGLLPNNGYIVANGALSLILPVISIVGDVISVLLDAGTSWTVNQNIGQQIRFGKWQTTAGMGGSLASTLPGDMISMVCTVANSQWAVINSVGNIMRV